MTEAPPHYIQLKPEHPTPSEVFNVPYKAILVVEAGSTDEWRTLVCNWLVSTGCQYALVWGAACEEWEDRIDETSVMFEIGRNGAYSGDAVLMTTHHKREELSEVFWFSKNCAFVDGVEFQDVLILHIAHSGRATELLKAYHFA